VGIGVRIVPLLLRQKKVCGKLLNSTKNKMKKKDYMEMEKEYKRGTKMLIIMFIIIVIGALVINQYSGI
jgi:hypothetical protein